MIRTLGYIVIGTRDLEAWRGFACDGLGLMATLSPDAGDALHLRCDDRPLRVRLEARDREGLVAVGWELADRSMFQAAIDALAREGVEVERCSDEVCASRCAREVVSFRDPTGARHELYHGTIYDHRPFVSPVGGAGFRTGDLGLGHVVLPAANVVEASDFFQRVLGFRLSDELNQGPVRLAFLRCNPRHHSLALASIENPTGMIHFMLECAGLDDVGYALDRIQTAGFHLSATLGKHTNDHMVSFYVRSPSGFDVEVGCGGVRVDDATWATGEITAPSFWGHRWDFGGGGPGNGDGAGSEGG
jgi:3,4-dihydroxy-9,10-secoandrosta-1,3,5(10)-triene-9,17-dione 4,5-dioxygenase